MLEVGCASVTTGLVGVATHSVCIGMRASIAACVTANGSITASSSESWDNHTQWSFIANILVRSSRKLFIFIIKMYIYGIKVSGKTVNFILTYASLKHAQHGHTRNLLFFELYFISKWTSHRRYCTGKNVSEFLPVHLFQPIFSPQVVPKIIYYYHTESIFTGSKYPKNINSTLKTKALKPILVMIPFSRPTLPGLR